ncbi:DUF930 domain-containing protein [Mesorhizobium sp. CO1-1-4]|uniref:DUF930 domain-containing protein n=1 Tax=Mesorhizobium sp. CO1-1-4 TaxID=2876633 RepID=UPI001CCF7BC1|nr:DUF930 domain-containing protein [Mesorhizobium sp. CO1-1-4]MBZ9740896.1 DUF930 domain-containing protein [Mesorhizobium sp. CO1-1-4]
MKDETREWRRNLLWGLAASLILHALVASFFIYGLSKTSQEPQQEQPISVALVPPPDQPKPKPQPPKAEKPPEPKAEKPPEQKVEKPPEQPRKQPDDTALKRVFQYRDKDTGPKKSLDGAAAKDNAPSPAKDDASKPPVMPKPAENKPAATVNAEQRPDASKADENAPTQPTDAKPTPSEEKQVTQDADKQQAVPKAADQQAAVTPKPLPTESDAKPGSAPEKPKAKAVKTMKFKSEKALKSRPGKATASNSTNDAGAGSPMYSGLPGVRKLYSQGATGDALATSSMSGVPRSQRVATLCANVLDQELQGADYSPKWLPTIPLKTGNVLDRSEAAFSTTTTWYQLSFRCEVDADATRVLSFNFRVGAEIPRSDWPPNHPL